MMDCFEVYQRGWALYITAHDRDVALAAGLIRACGAEEQGDFTLTDSATWDGLNQLLDDNAEV